jgi:putative transcriptional regulator
MHMSAVTSLANQFLIAMPQMADPNFSRTLTLICEHTDQGAMGLVVNRSMDLRVGQLLEHMDLEAADTELGRQPVYYGGPVEMERGFVLHRPLGAWENTIALSATLGLTASRDILEAMANGEGGPADAMIMLGYAGWGAGQLEAELADNTWLTLPAEEAILFEEALPTRWQAAASRLGVDLTLLSSEAGHA